MSLRIKKKKQMDNKVLKEVKEVEEVEELPEYYKSFNEFMDNYHRGEISGEEVGELIARMAQYYAHYNMQTVSNERVLSIIARDIEMRTDDNGKPISSTKAKIYVGATEESHAYDLSRCHLQNVEQFINSLKSLQKGVLNEYHHQSLS